MQRAYYEYSRHSQFKGLFLRNSKPQIPGSKYQGLRLNHGKSRVTFSSLLNKEKYFESGFYNGKNCLKP